MSDIQLIRENERLKIYIENYKNQLKDLDEEHKNEIQKLKNEYTKQIKEFEDKIKDLESKIDLQSKKRQITDVREISGIGHLSMRKWEKG